MSNPRDIRLLEYYAQRILNGKVLMTTSVQNPRKIKLYGAKISKPKWWQFWRWHLIKEWKKQCLTAYAKFAEDFDLHIK